MLAEFISEARFIMGVWRSKKQEVFLRAQHAAIARLIPVLYVAVAITTIALSFGYAASAPLWLSVGIPTAMLIPVGLRFRYWMSVRKKSEILPLAIIRRDIRNTNTVGPVIAMVFTAMGIGVLINSTSHHPEIAAIAIWLLALSSAFCLAVVPFSSILILLSAAGPLVLYLLSEHEHEAQAMGVVVTLVTFQVVYMLIRNYLSFFEMVHSKAELQERKEAAEAAEQRSNLLANTDYLTGLPNRRCFEQMLIERSNLAKQTSGSFAIGIIDLDGFKPVNDVYGHNAGDDVLVEVAKRLEQEVGTVCDIARLGGDEFAFMTSAKSEAEILRLSDGLQSALSQPYTVSLNRVVRLASSIGIASQKGGQADPLHLLAQADIALYRSKTNGKATTTLFTPDMELKSLQRARIEQGLRKAISKKELEVHFQPIYEISPQRLVGFEALARWNDSELGSISPAVFIPIAEETGLIGPLTELMLNKAATAAASWPDDLYLSFNLSAEQLVRESAGLRIITALSECGLAPQRLEIEVTETTLMKDLAAAVHTIQDLQSAGVRISLDDFGTGYSSLSHIRNLPLDKVKIDKSFIDEIVTDEKTRGLVSTIVAMCDALNITCTAEGIEENVQLEALTTVGCHSGQGYLFARPMPLAEAQHLINQTHPAMNRRRKAS